MSAILTRRRTTVKNDRTDLEMLKGEENDKDHSAKTGPIDRRSRSAATRLIPSGAPRSADTLCLRQLGRLINGSSWSAFLNTQCGDSHAGGPVSRGLCDSSSFRHGSQHRARHEHQVGTQTLGADKELRFFFIFLGDIHQPLHVSTNADAGGNCEGTTGFNGSDELHAAWDVAMVKRVMKPT